MHPQRVSISISEYLASESISARKHEYVDGETYAMSGASLRHNQIASNIQGRAWHAAQRTDSCLVFGSDMKLFVETRNSVYYPDLTVSCDPADRNDQYLARPCFIVEVLSPSTASIDRREKRTSYETLPSLREYVIVDQDRMRVQVYSRHAGVWLVRLLSQPDDTVVASCLNLTMTLEQIYDGVQFPPPGVAEEEAPEYWPTS